MPTATTHPAALVDRPRGPAPSLVAVLVLLVALAMLALPAPARAEPPSSVTVTDTENAVDPEILEGQLAEVDFRRAVDLQVLIVDVTDQDFSPSSDTALNDAVLAHARTSAPELLSEDGDHWADGTVILALDPSNRFLGSYAGEDVKLDEGGFEAVQDAMRDDARDGSWDDALLAGASKYAGLLDRPWWQHPGALVAGVVALGGIAASVLTALGLRGAARRRIDAALPRFEGVLAKQRMTDAAARSLSRESPYARVALADHEQYGERIDEADGLRSRIPAPHHRTWSWGLAGADRKKARSFESAVAFLDDIDDEIIAAHDLLLRTGDWRTAWDRELAPLQDSIGALERVLADGKDISPEEAAAAADLRELGGDVALEMDSLTTQLVAGRITPESALERLDTLTTELSAAVAALQRLRISRIAADDDEAEVLRDAGANVDEERRYRSLRGRRHELAADDRSDDTFWTLSPLLWYSSWNHESAAALETHRHPPSSSSGSTSGYSGSSGGFSGAGSSSRF
jgi:uncharacterized membrane protein YgcG